MIKLVHDCKKSTWQYVPTSGELAAAVAHEVRTGQIHPAVGSEAIREIFVSRTGSLLEAKATIGVVHSTICMLLAVLHNEEELCIDALMAIVAYLEWRQTYVTLVPDHYNGDPDLIPEVLIGQPRETEFDEAEGFIGVRAYHDADQNLELWGRIRPLKDYVLGDLESPFSSPAIYGAMLAEARSVLADAFYICEETGKFPPNAKQKGLLPSWGKQALLAACQSILKHPYEDRLSDWYLLYSYAQFREILEGTRAEMQDDQPKTVWVD